MEWLKRMLHRDTIAAVVCRPASRFSGGTLLEVLGDDGSAAFRDAVHGMFAFGDAHG